MNTSVRGLLVDIDGVLRLWPRRSAVRAALECGLPDNAVREIAYGGGFDLAHHGVWTHEQWVDWVRTRLAERFGAAGERAVDLWAADRGDPDPAMADLLRRARTTGLVTCALTNNTSALASDMTLHGLDDVFDHVANSADTQIAKPAPGAYTAALTLMDLPAADVVFTDDSPTNVTAALHLGLRAHHYTGPAQFEQFLADLGVTLPRAAAPRQPRPAPAATAPPAGHAEADEHTTASTRYLATGLPPEELAARLTARDPAAGTAVPLGTDALATVSPTGHLTTWRLMPHDAGVRAAAGHLNAWTHSPSDVNAEHLPPWLAATRAAAAPHAADLLHHTGWALHHLAATAGSDPLAAATHLDTVRQNLTALATVLFRHQPAPWPGTTASRYLPPTIREALTASLRTDPTTRTGLAAALLPLLDALRHLRHLTTLVLDTIGCWPWPLTAAALAPLLSTHPDLDASAPDDTLYTPALAAVYDRHRQLAPPIADALRDWAAKDLAGCVVVELGAGTGRITRELAGHGPRTYWATEPSIAMATRLRRADLPGVHVVEADALMLPLPDHGADIVVEHEVLQFTADPLRAAEEALRILRPGGRLVRLLLHPDGTSPLADIDTAYRQAAFANRPGPLFVGKGTDQRVTGHLATLGRATQTRTLAKFTQHRTAQQALDALADRAWPYQHQLTDLRHQRGMTAARHAAEHLPPHVAVPYTLRALITPADHKPEVR